MTQKTQILYKVRNVKGVTMTELVVVLAVITIVAALAALGSGFIGTERVRSTSKELLADLQWIRQAAMTQGPDASAPELRGFGIRLETTNKYRIFRFNDSNLNFAYDGTSEEKPLSSGEATARIRDIHNSVALRIKSDGAPVDPTNKVLIFDHLGIPRQPTMGFQQFSIVIQNPNLSDEQEKCISISFNRIREGQWDGSNCQEQ